MKSTMGFLDKWGDKESRSRVETSGFGSDVRRSDIENALKDMAMRFERSPNPSTIALWAKDFEEFGYTPQQVLEVCKTAPYKFQKHPTMAEIMDLLRPYLTKEAFSGDTLGDVSDLVFEHVKSKFVAMSSQEALDRMCEYYSKEVFPFMSGNFTKRNREMVVLNDWLRSYFTTRPEKIIEQGKKSNEAFERGDKEYFIAPLKRYAKENGL
jgi:hypothetical protein